MSMSLLDYDQKYSLLNDEPLTAEELEEIKFGHVHIATVLADIILRVKAPFTIGLFSKWGTGKTTIINLIEKKLKKERFKTVIFDTWKYEQDSLRRQFLINLDEQLNLKKDYKKKLNQSLTIPKDFYKESLKIIMNEFLVRVLLVIIMFCIVLFLIQNSLLNVSDFYKYIVNGAILIFFLGYILDAFKTVYGTVQINKIDSAEGFEDEFKKAISENEEIDKVLIVIDNLDRTSHEQAVNLLSDIKTFLSQDNSNNKNYNYNSKVIFLIACDEKAIKKHLEKCNFENPNEFLRKFFNTSLRIPKFLSLELDDYTKNLLNETEIKEFGYDKDLYRLITSEFRNNPREIKQFINTVVVTYIYARQMEESGEIVSKGIINKNIASLAKLLIIREKFPIAYEIIENKVILGILLWNDVYRGIYDYYPDELGDDENSKITKNRIDNEKKKFDNFLERTKYIDILELDVLIRLRQSEQEQKVPQIKSILIAAKDKNKKIFKEIISKIDERKLNYVDEYLRNFITKKIDKVEIWSIGSSVISLDEDKLKYLKQFIDGFVFHFPNQNDLLVRLDYLAPRETFNKIFNLVNEQNKENLVSAYTSLFDLSNNEGKSSIPTEYAKELFELIKDKKYTSYFMRHKEKIVATFQNSFVSSEFLDVFINTEMEDDFIKFEGILKYINSITVNDLSNFDNLENKLRVLNKLKLDISIPIAYKKMEKEDLVYETFKKFNEIILHEESHLSQKETRVVLVSSLKNFIEKYFKEIKQIIEKEEGKTIIKSITIHISKWFIQDQKEENIYVELLVKLRKFRNNNAAEVADSAIKNYIKREITFDIVNKINKDDLKSVLEIYPDEIKIAIEHIPEINKIIKDIKK